MVDYRRRLAIGDWRLAIGDKISVPVAWVHNPVQRKTRHAGIAPCCRERHSRPVHEAAVLWKANFGNPRTSSWTIELTTQRRYPSLQVERPFRPRRSDDLATGVTRMREGNSSLVILRALEVKKRTCRKKGLPGVAHDALAGIAADHARKFAFKRPSGGPSVHPS
jgi:hypothetical protein